LPVAGFNEDEPLVSNLVSENLYLVACRELGGNYLPEVYTINYLISHAYNVFCPFATINVLILQVYTASTIAPTYNLLISRLI